MAGSDTVVAASPASRGLDPHRESGICEATLELLQEVGYERLTVDAVSARAHASKATIYRHWPKGKAQLVVRALKCRAVPVSTCPDTGSLRTDLLALLGGIREAMTREEVVLIAGLMLAMHTDDDLALAVRTEVIADKRHLSEDLIAQAEARGEYVRPGAAALLHELLPALILTNPLLRGELVDDAYILRAVDDVLIPVLQPAALQPASSRKETP